MTDTQKMMIGLALGFAILVMPSVPHAGMLPSQALQSAERFLSMLDNQQWDKAYQAAAEPLRLLNRKQDWIDEQSRRNQLLGQAQQRQLTAVRTRDHYPGLPDGNYLIILYTTRTPTKQEAREVLVLKGVAESWQVCRYSLR